MEHSKETGTDQELMRSMKVSKAVAAMADPKCDQQSGYSRL